MRRFPLVPAMICVLLCIGDGMARVRVEETTVTLPTCPPGPYDKNPIFYTGRVYQGAQGRVYPYPLQDTLHDEKVDQTYTSLRLENECLEMTLLPNGSPTVRPWRFI